MIYENFSYKNIVTLYEGDCLDFLKKIPDKSTQLVVTSPPYNVGKEYEKKIKIEKYLEFQKKVIGECHRILKDEGSICWQVGNYIDSGQIIPIDTLIYPIFSELGMQMRNRIIWHFGHGLHAQKRLSGRYETINWFTKTKNYFFNLDPIRIPQKYPNKKYFKGLKKGQLSCNPLGKNPSDIWEIPNVKNNHVEKTSHPCQFPVELVERLILSMTKTDDLVLDPFAGSGTTFVAALIHKRRCAGSEIENKYIKIAKKRIESALNDEAKIRSMKKEIYKEPLIIKQNDLFDKRYENYL
ncbi:MAG: site-specific DNA-methyltransferase [Rickettsiales bacterium]|nr:site-specific DNA-methyltransferase [Rickettsiales bacterium]